MMSTNMSTKLLAAAITVMLGICAWILCGSDE